MKRATASLTSLLLAAGFVLGAGGPAQAAPLPAAYSGSAGGSVVNVAVTTDDLNLTGVRLANAQSTVGTTLTPRVVSRSTNLSATVAGLGLAVNANQETAPPNNDGAEPGELASVTAAGISAGVLETSNEAHYVNNNTCVPGDLLADSRVSTAGVSVAPTGLTAVETGDAATTGLTELVTTTGLNRGVRSTATGTISNTELLNGTVAIGIAGTSSLTATALGTAGDATVAYVPGTVTVTVDGETFTIAPGATQTFDVDVDGVVGSVTVTANQAQITTSADGTSARASVSVVTAQVRLGPAGDPTATATVNLLPLNAAAAVPAGGIDCAPNAPTLARPADGSVTTDTTPTFSGSGTPGATITLTVDGRVIEDAAVVDGDGAWRYTPTTPLAEGDYTASATQTVNGAESVRSNANDFTIDATVEAPVITAPEDGSSTDDTTPTITGTGEPGGTVEVRVDGVLVDDDVPVDADGNFSVDVTTPLDEGPHTVTAVQTDEAGNVSDPAESTFAVDVTAPTLTTPVDGSTTRDTTPPFTGQTAPNTEVEILVDGKSIGTTTSNGTGAYSFTPTTPLDEGDHTAVAKDEAGNESNANDFTVDATGPTVTAPADGSTTRDNTPTFTGQSDPNTDVEIFVDGESVGTTTTDDDGNFSLTPVTPLDDGDHAVTAVDEVGNVSQANDFTVDTVPPATPVVTTPDNGDVVDDRAPITGTGEPGTTVAIIIDGVKVGEAVVDDDGNFSFTPKRGQLTGRHSIAVQGSDDAGNLSPRSTPIRVTGVTVSDPVIARPANGAVVDSNRPVISGTGEPGATLTLRYAGTQGGGVAGQLIGTTVVAADGTWSVRVPSALAAGSYTVQATQSIAGFPDRVSNLTTFRVPGVAGGGDDNGGSGPGVANPVGGDPNTTLASTGGPSLLIALLGGFLFIGGALTIGVGQARRRKALLLGL